MTTVPSTTPTNAIVYVCEPDAAASIAAADDLAGTAQDRGFSVRAVVADTAARDSALGIRRGWAAVSQLLAASDSMLVVRSRADLGRSEDLHTMALGPLCDGRVLALRPEPWEDQDWTRAWRAPERAAGWSGEPDCGQLRGMCCAVFPAREVHVAHARRMTRRFLEPLEQVLGEELHYLLLVAVTELVTNAITHGSRPGDLVTLKLEREPHALCVTVEDTSTEPPCLRSPDHHDNGGRGMHLVTEVTKRWGYTPFADGTGKHVWMRVPHPRSHHRPLAEVPAAHASRSTP